MSAFLFVTGMSGAGRSTAAAALEDLGWFVIDNLPPALITKVAELVARPGSESERVVAGITRPTARKTTRSPPATTPGHQVSVYTLRLAKDIAPANNKVMPISVRYSVRTASSPLLPLPSVLPGIRCEP